MSDIPPPFLRVAALAVQGLMNRSPRKNVRGVLRSPPSGEARLVVEIYPSNRISRSRKRASSKIYMIILTIPGLSFGLYYSPLTEQWFSEKTSTFLGEYSGRGPSNYGSEFYDEHYTILTQKEVETALATIVTAPYRIERVSTEAVRAAQELIEESVAYDE